MAEKSRGLLLTTFAVLFAILSLSNFSKPFHLDPNAGFVFFGVKTHGMANAILGPAFGLILVLYAIGIWRMRRWVLPIAYAYAAYVILNLLLYSMRNAVIVIKPTRSQNRIVRWRRSPVTSEACHQGIQSNTE